MKDKARANLMASKQLLRAKLADPAMSRLYYSLFQAAVHGMSAAGRTPREFGQRDEWKHDTICGNANVIRKRREDLALFRDAKSLRIRADYMPAPVNAEQVRALLPHVEAFVAEVCA